MRISRIKSYHYLNSEYCVYLCCCYDNVSATGPSSGLYRSILFNQRGRLFSFHSPCLGISHQFLNFSTTQLILDLFQISQSPQLVIELIFIISPNPENNTWILKPILPVGECCCCHARNH